MAAVLTQRAAEPVPAGYSKTSRRQYQACDQCRKSRRACDAGTLRVANFPFREDELPESSALTCDACSNCTRTSKRCTFLWLSRLPLQGLPKGVKRKLESTGLPKLSADAVPDLNYQASYHSGYVTSGSSTLPQLLPATDTFPLMHNSAHAGQSKYHLPPTYASPEQNVNYPCASPEARYPPAYSIPRSTPSFVTVSNGSTRATSLQSIPDPTFALTLLSEENTTLEQWKPPTLSQRDATLNSPFANSNGSSTAISKIDSSPSLTSVHSELGSEEDVSQGHSSKRVKRASVPSDHCEYRASGFMSHATPGLPDHSRLASPSLKIGWQDSAPLSSSQLRFVDKATKRMIATGLFRIYHDSFENSLSCWVTEKNCPYNSELVDLSANASPVSTAEEAALRLSDNRILSRVSRLDSAFARLRGRDLSPAENRSANNALQAAVMAFASQWSHSSHNAFWRSKEGMAQMKACQSHSTSLFSHPGRASNPSPSTDSERLIQKTLWHEARTAVQDSADIDSFKVTLAYMIFALTQRPIDAKSKPPSEVQASPTDNIMDSRRGSEDSSLYESPDRGADPTAQAIANQEWNPFCVSDLEALASPPHYLETAVRNLFSWRRKIEQYRRLRSRNNRDYNSGSMGPLVIKDHQTFNLFFWLGVMCDTTSSAISKRPLVISDEDCAMIREFAEDVDSSWSSKEEQYLPETEGSGDSTGNLWGDYLLSFRSALSRKTQPRWPCNFDTAASVLQEAIPVKVLMFRKVAALQTLAYRNTSPHQLEKCIKEALDVYRHWNLIYGCFMNDCVNEHNNLPSHVQSWYVILDGHWHYGCLLLADTISQIDREGKTMKPQRTLRANCHLITELRQDNALAIAKIAQASLSEHIPSVPDNTEFHFACNGSAILTEPWTDILVRAMGTACKIFINWLSSWDNSMDPEIEWVRTNSGYQDLYDQAEACIQAMALLGRKSDSANCTAEVFWAKLSQVASIRRASTESAQNENRADVEP